MKSNKKCDCDCIECEIHESGEMICKCGSGKSWKDCHGRCILPC